MSNMAAIPQEAAPPCLGLFARLSHSVEVALLPIAPLQFDEESWWTKLFKIIHFLRMNTHLAISSSIWIDVILNIK